MNNIGQYGAYVRVSKDKIIASCQGVIKNIHAARSKARRDWINHRYNQLCASWLGWHMNCPFWYWFAWNAPTKRDAIRDYLSEDGRFSRPRHNIQILHQSQMLACKQAIIACNLTDYDYMLVSPEMLEQYGFR